MFKFDEFVKYIHESFSQDFSLEEVRELLYLEDDGYNKSIPDSPQKRLLLQWITIEGVKTNGTSFLYERELLTGVSMWIADNLKGKSSIFKAIRFALTGRDKFTPLMKQWFKRIVLQFSIHEATYTVVLGFSGAQLKAEVFNCSIIEMENNEPLESFKSRDSYADFMQNLFFEEFDYYPIKRVQATQQSVNLSDSDLSWTSYYSSIYHQSKDYGNLEIGNQHAMVFQMLLGLVHTYSIHALESKAKKAEREWNLKNEQDRQVSPAELDIKTLQTQLAEVTQQISDLNNGVDKKAIEKIQESLKLISDFTETTRRSKIEIDSTSYQYQKVILDGENHIKEKQDLIRQFGREINKQKRLITEYQEYIDSGILFNNLQVTECPHCDHEVDRNKFKIEKESRICMLCDHEMIEEGDDTAIWEYRIKVAQEEILSYELLTLKEQNNGRNFSENLDKNQSELLRLKKESTDLEGVLVHHSENVASAQAQLDGLLKKVDKNYFNHFEELLQKKVKLESEISLAEKFIIAQSDLKLKRKAELFRKGHNLLIRRRRELGSDILMELEGIMLKQLHALGLVSYTRVLIRPENFTIQYYQGEIANNFNDITEGEQLRAKLALYLSLIELDLEKSLGRHPRLIILDSPTKEEGDQHFVEGLKNTLLHIEEKFGDKVQVIVGTANRDLKDVISDDRKLEYRAAGQFVF